MTSTRHAKTKQIDSCGTGGRCSWIYEGKPDDVFTYGFITDHDGDYCGKCKRKLGVRYGQMELM